MVAKLSLNLISASRILSNTFFISYLNISLQYILPPKIFFFARLQSQAQDILLSVGAKFKTSRQDCIIQ